MYKKILIPTDGSEHANRAAKHALWIAKESGAEILALSVIETAAFIGLPADDLIMSTKNLLEEEASRALDKLKNLVKDSGYNIKLTLNIDEGSAADTILKVAEKENVDLIVMGTSGKHGIDRFLLGSVTEKVVRHATCPVLVVH